MVDGKNVATKRVIPAFSPLRLMNRIGYGALYKGHLRQSTLFVFQQRSINVRVRRDEELDARTGNAL